MGKMLRTSLNLISKCNRQVYCNLQCSALHLSYSVDNWVSTTNGFKDNLKNKISQLSAFENVDCIKSLDSHQCFKIVPEETKLILKEFKFLNSKKEKADVLYILYPDLADLMIAKLGQDSCRRKSVIFEINPGPGIVTKKLLEAGFSKIKVFETNPVFLPYLLKLQEDHPNKLKVYHMDFFSIPKKLATNNPLDAENQKKIFEDVIVRSWSEDDPPLILVGALPPSKERVFLRYLINKLASMRSLYSYGRAELFVFLSGNEIEYMFSTPSKCFTYRYSTIMYRLFYDIKVLFKESRMSFYPPQRPVNRKKMYAMDSEHLYLLKIIPKKNVFSMGLSVDQFQRFLFFVRHLLHRRSWYLIEQLGKWVPKTDLFKMGYTKETKTGDLQPEEFIHLFKKVINQTNYGNITFKLAINHNLDEDDDEHPQWVNSILPSL